MNLAQKKRGGDNLSIKKKPCKSKSKASKILVTQRERKVDWRKEVGEVTEAGTCDSHREGTVGGSQTERPLRHISKRTVRDG